LGVQIAFAVDVPDQLALRLRRALRGEPSLLRRAAKSGELRPTLLERLTLLPQGVEGSRVRRDALAIEPGERRDGARGLSEPAQVWRREQQTQVARFSELVDLDEPRAKLRRFVARRLLE